MKEMSILEISYFWNWTVMLSHKTAECIHIITIMFKIVCDLTGALLATKPACEIFFHITANYSRRRVGWDRGLLA